MQSWCFNIFQIPGDFFDVYVLVLNSNSLAKRIFHVYVFVSVTRWIKAKSARYVYLILNQWCSECLTYVYVYWVHNSGPKTKNVSFPLDGLAIRSANRRFARIDSRESICRRTAIFITCKWFVRIASNLRFASFSPPKGFISGTLNRFARISRIDLRESGHLSLFLLGWCLTLSFLSLVFLSYQGKTLKSTKDFCSLPNPLKPWKNQRKHTNSQGTSLLKINQGIPKNQRKDRVEDSCVKGRQSGLQGLGHLVLVPCPWTAAGSPCGTLAHPPRYARVFTRVHRNTLYPSHGQNQNHGLVFGFSFPQNWARNRTCENRTCENWQSTLLCTFPWTPEYFPWALLWESSWWLSCAKFWAFSSHWPCH